MNTKTAQGGFTLIELVVVITILGILAAFAVPRFVSLEKDARVATVQALAGSVRSAAALSHALWLTQGEPATVTMEGQAITMSSGYPDAAGIELSLSGHDGFSYDSMTKVFSKTSDGSTNAASAIANCIVTYTEATAASAPSAITTTSGC